MSVKTVTELVKENPSLLNALNPSLGDTTRIRVEGLDRIAEMIGDQSDIVRQCKCRGADPTYAAGIRDGLMYALGILKFEEVKQP